MQFMYKGEALNEPGNVDFGNHDISGIGDGTVTGAIKAMNSEFGETTQSNEYGINFVRRNNVVSAYGYLSNLPTGATVTLGSAPYKSVSQYSCLNVYSSAAPYTQIGTIWIDRNGNLTIYKPENITSCYVSGSFVCQ